MDWTKRLAGLALLTIGAAAPAPPGPAALVAAVPQGPAHDAVRKWLLRPYAEATQTLLADPAWDGDNLDALKTLAPDLALVDGAHLLAGCRAGQFRKLDWGRLGRDRYLDQAVSDCGAGAYLTAVALAWDRDKFTTAPLWSDFWDVARHPGRRGLQRAVRGNLEFALLADGVSAGDVYRSLRTPEGVDRAFRKLDQLKSFIQWWDQPSQPALWLATGKVLLTSAPTAGLAAAGGAGHKRLAAQWVGSLVSTESFAVPQNAPHAEVAAVALAVAGDPARQAMLASATTLGPAVREAVDLLPAAALADNVAAPNNLPGALPMDESFWADNGAKLEKRFETWLSK